MYATSLCRRCGTHPFIDGFSIMKHPFLGYHHFRKPSYSTIKLWLDATIHQLLITRGPSRYIVFTQCGAHKRHKFVYDLLKTIVIQADHEPFRESSEFNVAPNLFRYLSRQRGPHIVFISMVDMFHTMYTSW